jgi:hypothetical protein
MAEGAVCGQAAFGTPIDEAPVVLAGVAKGVVVPHRGWGAAIELRAEPDGEGLDEGVGALGFVQTVAPSVFVAPKLGDVEDVGGVEVDGGVGLSLVAKEDGADGDGGDGIVEGAVDSVVALVVLAAVGHPVPQVVYLGALCRLERAHRRHGVGEMEAETALEGNFKMEGVLFVAGGVVGY